MLSVDDFLGDGGRDALRQERLERLKKTAFPFLRKHFAPLLVARTDAALMEAVANAVPAAERRGFRSESDIFSFLIPVVLLGHRFETDPQYGAMLTQAGWIAADGSLTQRPNLALLQLLIDEHLDAVRSDDADLQTRTDAFATLYRQNPDVTDASEISRWMAYLWPARAAWTGDRGLQMLALALHRRKDVLQVPPVDFLAICGLSFRLGHGCLDDPLCAWLADGVAHYSDGADAGREALGMAVIREISARQIEAKA